MINSIFTILYVRFKIINFHKEKEKQLKIELAIKNFNL